MQTKAPVLTEVPGRWEIVDVELDAPREHEVLIRTSAAKLHGRRWRVKRCRQDDPDRRRAIVGSPNEER